MMTEADTSLLMQMLGDAPAVAVGGAIGYLIARFTLSKHEKKEHEQVLFENSLKLKRGYEARYQSFHLALEKYLAKTGPTTLEDFHDIAKNGSLYIGDLSLIADAILEGNVDRRSRDKTFVIAIREAITKTIPVYYETLHSIGEKVNVPYEGKFRRENYENMFDVAEKYGSTLPPKKPPDDE